MKIEILFYQYLCTEPQTNNHTTIQQCELLSRLSPMSFFPWSRLTFKMKSRPSIHVAFARQPVFKHSSVLGSSAHTATQPITPFALAVERRMELTLRESICAKRAPSTSSRSWQMAGDSNPTWPTTNQPSDPTTFKIDVFHPVPSTSMASSPSLTELLTTGLMPLFLTLSRNDRRITVTPYCLLPMSFSLSHERADDGSGYFLVGRYAWI